MRFTQLPTLKVKRTLQGRAYEYRAIVTQEQVSAAMMQDMIHRLFDGSADRLVLTLIENNQVDLDRICQLACRDAATKADR